jgi:hypothetical protein
LSRVALFSRRSVLVASLNPSNSVAAAPPTPTWRTSLRDGVGLEDGAVEVAVGLGEVAEALGELVEPVAVGDELLLERLVLLLEGELLRGRARLIDHPHPGPGEDEGEAMTRAEWRRTLRRSGWTSTKVQASWS